MTSNPESHSQITVLCFHSQVSLSAILNTILDSVTTRCVPESGVGAALGLNSAVSMFCRAFCPVMGVYVYSLFGLPSLALLGSTLSASVTIFLALYGEGPL